MKHGRRLGVCGVGERNRQGNGLWLEMSEGGVIRARQFEKSARADLRPDAEPPGSRCAWVSPALRLRNISRDQETPRRAALHRQHFPFCAGRLGSFRASRPHAFGRGYSPNLNTEIGGIAGAHHFDEEWVDHFRAGHYVPPTTTRTRHPAATFAHLDGDDQP